MIKIPIVVQIVILTVALTGFYTMVGQAVPQKEVQPPEVIEIDLDISSAEMAEIGRGIFEGKGICLTCHANTSRYPDLQGVASRAGARKPGYSALDYLTETLYEPSVYLVEGFADGMQPVHKPPIGLTDGEILTVIAYLQTLGGEPTVTMETKHAYNGGAFSFDGGGEVAPEGEVALAAAGDGAEATGPLATFGCTQCHYTDRAGELDGGPSLFDVGSRLSRDQLLSELVYHEGEDGLNQVTQADLQNLVTVMTELKGQG